MNPDDEAPAPSSLPARYFDDVYAAHDDPWSFETSAYEAAKYDHTLAVLGERRFSNAFEIGCSIGVLTERLAQHCDRLLAVDISEAPLVQARRRCAALPQVRLLRMDVPQTFPAGRFDLVVMSEVGYYWTTPDLAHAAQHIAAALAPGGLWLLVHWTPAVPDYPLRGDEVHDFALAFARDSGRFEPVLEARQPRYRINLLQRRPG